jgi:hypothetical protein
MASFTTKEGCNFDMAHTLRAHGWLRWDQKHHAKHVI